MQWPAVPPDQLPTSKPNDQCHHAVVSTNEKTAKRKRNATVPQSTNKEALPDVHPARDSESASKSMRLMDGTKDSVKDSSLTFSFDGTNWNDESETIRRFRAKVVASHAKENYERNRSEFAWEADAWRDVFGNLRDDDFIAMDKRSYFSVKPNFQTTDPPSEKGSFIERIPDMTFGLKPFEYQEWLRDVKLHPEYGLIADPKWSDITLLFPFMVYEAKAQMRPGRWTNPADVAWEQGLHAALAYLGLQESLMRVPGRAEKDDRPLQSSRAERCDPRCFVLTSVGPQWTIYGVYPTSRRGQGFYTWSSPIRYGLAREAFKMWSGDVQSERSAWELLHQVDTIQQWARASYRDMIQHYLGSWHKAIKRDILFEWKTDKGGQQYRVPRQTDVSRRDSISIIPDLTMPFWAMAVDKRWSIELRGQAHDSFKNAYDNTEDGRELKKTWRHDWVCPHKDHECPNEVICFPRARDVDKYVEEWLAGPGQGWQ